MNKPFEYFFNDNNGEAFDYNGKKISLSYKRLVLNNQKFSVENFKSNSKWKQGVVVHSFNGFLKINKTRNDKIVLWEDTIPKVVDFEVDGNSTLVIYNVWDIGNGVMQYGHNGAGLYIKEENDRVLFFCNDGYPDDDLDDLTFDLVIDNDLS